MYSDEIEKLSNPSQILAPVPDVRLCGEGFIMFVCVQYYFTIMKRITGGLMFQTTLLLLLS